MRNLSGFNNNGLFLWLFSSNRLDRLGFSWLIGQGHNSGGVSPWSDVVRVKAIRVGSGVKAVWSDERKSLDLGWLFHFLHLSGRDEWCVRECVMDIRQWSGTVDGVSKIRANAAGMDQSRGDETRVDDGGICGDEGQNQSDDLNTQR